MEEFPQESKSCEMERQKLTLQISDVAPLTLGDQRPSVALYVGWFGAGATGYPL